MRFSPQFLDEIRARVPVADVVGRAVQWDRRKSQPSKGDYWGCCPFHNEKTPSFHADNRKGRYHCFGCQASGDIFTFLTEKEGVSFPEAVERLAGEAGLPMPQDDPRERERAQVRASLHDVMELATRFFQDKLQGREGAAARGYLSDRGLAPSALATFRIGYAPGARYALKEHLAEKKVTGAQMAAAGLVVTGEDISVPFDRFRDRIMFPITDLRGRIVGFGGRAMAKDAQAKYMNSPETDLFHKRGLLYNAAGARAAAHERGQVIAVEGYMDVIALAEAGFANAVAPLGTALTEDQIRLLWRFAEEPVLCFDGDAAGVKAAYRALDTALPLIAPGKSLSFALLPEGQDPDDLVRQAGRAAFEAVLKEALPLSEMMWQRESEGADFSTPERRAAFERRIDEVVRLVGDDSVRRHYHDEFRGRIARLWQGRGGASSARAGNTGDRGDRGGRYREERRTGAYWAARRAPSRSFRASALVGGAAPLSTREALLVLTMINHPDLLEEEAEGFEALEIANHGLDRLRRAILDIAAHDLPDTAGAMRARLEAAGHGEIIARIGDLARRGRDRFALEEAPGGQARTGWRHTAALHRKASTLNKELAAAEQALAEDGTEESLARLRAIQDQIETLEGREALVEGFGNQA